MKQMIVKCAAVVAAVLMGSIAWAEATIVYVAPDGSGDGTSWNSPTTFEGAMLIGAGNKEIEVWMKEGTYLKTADSVTYNFNQALTVRGGFAGTETSAAERAAGTYSTIDGQDLYNTFVAYVRKSAEFERVIFTKSRTQGFNKSQNGSVTLKDCQFVRNGITAGNFKGRGAGIWGNTSSSEVVIEDCVFDRNTVTNMVNDMGAGWGLYLEGAKSARIVNCSFEDDGYSHSITNRAGNRTGATVLSAVNAPVAVTNCTFVGNMLYAGSCGAVVWLSGNCDGSTFDHCVFKGNRLIMGGNYPENSTSATGVFNVDLGAKERTVDITSCTFAYNISATLYGAAGLNVLSGTANVKDSIFYGNVIPATGSGDNDVMVLSGSGAANISYTMIDHVPATAVCESMVIGTPDFVTSLETFLSYIYMNGGEATYPKVNKDPHELTFKGDDETFAAVLAMDVHCKSKAGYYKNDGVLYTDATVTSRAIDAGDPESAYGNEGAPNGGRINLGVYGNTAEAAKSVVGGQPELAASDVKLEWVDGYTQPKVTATIGGAAEYNATVAIMISTDGSNYTKAYEVSGVRSGESVTWTYPGYMESAAHLYYSVVVTAPGASEVKVDQDSAVSGELPPWYGKGGDAAKIVHVRAGANGKKDGTSWTDAYASWSQAVKGMTSTRNEIWVAGTNVVDREISTYRPNFHFTIRGGFDGSENAIEERKAGVVSVVDGADAYDMLTLETTKTTIVERVVLMRGKTRGVYRKGNGGALIMKDCRLLMNGLRAGNTNGRGVYVEGNATTEAVFEGCSFEGNIDGVPSYDAGCGYGVYVTSLGKAVLVDCVFLTNGYRYTQGNLSHRSRPSTFEAYKTPVALTNCAFIANRTSGSTSGAVVYLSDNCDGSTFDHCAWVGNSIFKTNDGWSEKTTSQMSIFGIGLGALERTVEMNNCTVAYNLSCTVYNAAGIDVHSGTLNIRNSIIYGNIVPATSTATDNDLVVLGAADKAAANVSYTLMDHTPATATCENMVIGVPQFVTPVETFMSYIYTNTTAVAEFPKVNTRPIDMRFNWDDETVAAVVDLDVHCLSRAGYYKNDGLKYMDAKVGSPAVDAGDPASDFTKEGAPNGHRVNLGFYGNTAQAALSKGGFCLRIQ